MLAGDRTTFEWKFKRRLFRANITSARDMHFGPDQSTAAGEVNKSSCSALEGSCQKQGTRPSQTGFVFSMFVILRMAQ